MFKKRAFGWQPKLPDSIINNDKKINKPNRNVYQEGEGKRKRKTSRRRKRVGRRKRKELLFSAVLLKEHFPRFVDNGAKGKQMHHRCCNKNIYPQEIKRVYSDVSCDER